MITRATMYRYLMVIMFALCAFTHGGRIMKSFAQYSNPALSSQSDIP